jgi:hypothetical protein
MILRGLRTGFMEGDGPFYRQPRAEIRPRPKRSFDDRVYAVASSDDSVVSAARLNARMVMFADRPWPIRMPAIQKHRDLVREIHGKEAGPPLLADFCVCTPTMDGAEETARRYMGKFVESNFYHYELLGPHFASVKGYDAYAQKIAMAREIGMDGIVSAFMQAAVWGTPDRILRTLEERRALVGAFELATSFRFGGTPLDLAESGLRLYAKRSCRSSSPGPRVSRIARRPVRFVPALSSSSSPRASASAWSRRCSSSACDCWPPPPSWASPLWWAGTPGPRSAPAGITSRWPAPSSTVSPSPRFTWRW